MSNNSAAVEQKATVKKLTPNDLKIFMTTDFDLSELYKLQSFANGTKHAQEHSYNNLNVIENMPCITEANTSTPERFKTPIHAQVAQEINRTLEEAAITQEIEEESHNIIAR